MKSKCNVIKDILPLYAENIVSEDTKEFVEEHLSGCAACRAELEQMRRSAGFAPDTDVMPLKKMKKKLQMKRMQTAAFTAAIVMVILVSAFAILTAPEYFPYSEDLLQVSRQPEGTITISFDEKVTGYSSSNYVDADTGVQVYHIDAWSTPLDSFFGERGKQNVVIPPGNGKKVRVFYAQNNGADDVLIFGPDMDADAGIRSLPRLVLWQYFLLASGGFGVLAVLWLFLRKKEHVSVWLGRAAFLPASYMAAQLCTKGLVFVTYSLPRDFALIILVAMLIYCAALSGISLYRSRKA